MENGSQGDVYETWTYIALLAMVVVLPLVMSQITMDMFDIAKLVAMRLLTLLAIAFWLLKMLSSKKSTLRWLRIDILLIGFIGLAILSTILSIHVPTSLHGKYMRFEGLFTFLNYVAIYVLALQVFTSSDRIKTLVRLLALVGGAVSIYGLIQFAGLDPLTWPSLPFEERRSFSTFGNPDFLAGFLVLILPVSLVSFLTAKNARNNAIYGSILFLISACLVTSYTRGAWIGAAVGITVFAVAAGKSALSSPKKLIAITSIVIISIALVGAYASSTINFVERVTSATQVTEGSVGTRVEIWRAALRAIQQRPLLGFGPDTFRLVSQKYETFQYVYMTGGKSTADNAHDYPLQLAAGVGVPAALCLVIFVLGAIWLSLRLFRYSSGEQKLLYTGLIGSVAGYFIHLLFGLSVIGSSALFWLIIGAMLSQAYVVRSSGATLARVVTVIALAVILVATYFALSMYAADYHFNRGLRFKDKGYPDRAIEHYEAAIRSYKNGLYYDWYGRYLLGLGSTQNNTIILHQAKNLFETVTKLEPDETDHWLYLANANAALSKGPGDTYFDEARTALETALASRPYSTIGQLMLGDTYKAEGNYEESLKLFGFVMQVDPASKEAHLLTAEIYRELGKKELALRHYRKYEELNPGDQKVRRVIQSLEPK